MLFGKKSNVLRELQSGDVIAVRQALDDCRANGWLFDGSLRSVKIQGVDLSRANLEGADLSHVSLLESTLRGANLRSARLNDANLSLADLSHADLRDAVLDGTVLEEANLSEALIDYVQLVLADSMADATMPDQTRYDGRFDLPGDLEAARQDGVYPDEPGQMAEWYGVSMDDYQCGESWAVDHLDELRVRAQVALVGPRDPWAAQMRLSGALTDGSLRGEDLAGRDFSHTDLHDAVLPEAILVEASLSYADLRDANLRRADLAASDLQDAALTGADLRGADLSEADCGGAVFISANLEGAVLDAALLDQANFQDAQVTDEQLVHADRLAGATMPDGSLYDGRYELLGDIEEALDDGIDIDQPREFADWYNITVEAYEAGQKWARENLARLRPEDESADETSGQ